MQATYLKKTWIQNINKELSKLEFKKKKKNPTRKGGGRFQGRECTEGKLRTRCSALLVKKMQIKTQ